VLVAVASAAAAPAAAALALFPRLAWRLLALDRAALWLLLARLLPLRLLGAALLLLPPVLVALLSVAGTATVTLPILPPVRTLPLAAGLLPAVFAFAAPTFAFVPAAARTFAALRRRARGWADGNGFPCRLASE